MGYAFGGLVTWQELVAQSAMEGVKTKGLRGLSGSKLEALKCRHATHSSLSESGLPLTFKSFIEDAMDTESQLRRLRKSVDEQSQEISRLEVRRTAWKQATEATHQH